MNSTFRDSEFIDFNTGLVKLAPLQLQFKMTMAGQMQFADLVRLFECHIEVWQLGVAVQLVKQIESYLPPSIWAHSAYGLLTILIPYFETIGTILNPEGASPHPNEMDFEYGFRDVYSEVVTSSGKSYDPKEFYRRIRNGLVPFGTTAEGLWVHNTPSISTKDFDIVRKKPTDPSSERYYVNPHALVRTLVAHFPTFIQRLNDPDVAYDPMRARLRKFFRNQRGP